MQEVEDELLQIFPKFGYPQGEKQTDYLISQNLKNFIRLAGKM